jgi:general stress protein 26
MSNPISGLNSSFKLAKIVFLTTFTEDGKEHSRKMTNINEDPSKPMWFPTYMDTKKIQQIRKNPKVLITFPAEETGEFYEIEGSAEIQTGNEIQEKWFWWYLYWKPTQRRRFWFPPIKSDNRAIIQIKPISTRLVKP